jgi:N-methylhydantoinase A/oxoprolinase/acetone carboxylase beta subunit
VDEATGAVRVDKLLTRPKEPAQAVEQAVVTLLHEAGSVPASVESLIHGATLATNLLIERNGAKTGLLTTAGFRDALEIGREGRYDMCDLFIDPPAPLVSRHRRLEVTERILADGSVLTPFDESSARAAIDALLARMLSFDMGGATAKACVIDGGEPFVAREFEVARADRFKKGSGLPIRGPVIEMIEIGAGGGSITRIDSLGLLKVGPESAGADPGPACYALGG